MNRSPTTPNEPYTTVKDPKNSASTSAVRRCHTPVTTRRVYSRTAKKALPTATGFHRSNASHGGRPSAESPPEITTAG